MPPQLKNKTILITGANRGIGKAILVEALHRGAEKVYAAVRSLDSASALVAEHGDRVVPIKLDLDDPASITAAAATAEDVDIVVNNAGVMKFSTAVGEDVISSLEFEMNANVYGLIRVAQAFAPALKSKGGGTFVQLNSIASVKTFPGIATYCASKAASYAITQGLRGTLGSQGTQVVSVHPGPIQTDMAEEAGFGDSAAPPASVANAIFDGIANGSFHVWPDPRAKQIEAAYHSFATAVVEAN